MNDERKRIEKMLAEGRVTRKEADGLLAALEKSEKKDTASPPAEVIEKPRLSTLAQLGVLALPAAGVMWLVISGVLLAALEDDDEAVAIGAIIASIVVIIGVICSIAGLITIRSNPDKLRGRKLALAGIFIPVILAIVVFIAAFLMFRNREVKMQETVKRMELEARWNKITHQVRDLAEGFVHTVRAIHEEKDFAQVLRDRQKFIALIEKYLEPGWVQELKNDNKKAGNDTLLEIMTLNELAEYFKEAKVKKVEIPGGSGIGDIELSRYSEEEIDKLAAQLDNGIVILSGTKKELRVPVVKINGEWYFAKKKVIIREVQGNR